MSPTPTSLNPSQTVERIREIIVGRQLERLEGRISRLEAIPRAGGAKPIIDSGVLEDRILANEARVEALQDHVHRLGHNQEDMERAAAMYRQEAQRLASQIQEVVRERSAASASPVVEGLERRLGAWLTDWQKSMNSRLESRDRILAERVRAELATMKESIDARISELEARTPHNVEERFSRIAAAARALAESAGSLGKPF